MDGMSSSGGLQKQIAGIMDELCRAAVQEIGRVLDDGVLLLRLQVCEREHEIDALKQNLQLVSEELRQTRRALLRQCVSGGRTRHLVKGAKEKGKTANEEKEPGPEEPPCTAEKNKGASEVLIKLESTDENPTVTKKTQRTRTDPDLQSSSTDEDQAPQVWSSETDTEIQDPQFYSSQRLADRPSAAEQDYDVQDGGPDTEDLDDEEELSADGLHATADELLRGPNCAELTQSLAYTHPPQDGQVDFGALGVVSRGRPMVGIGSEKRRFACAFCIKSFDRLSHLDRHQRIHTGEKPFSCVLCGRSFTQKSSLKSHLKTHRGFTAELDAASLLPHENKLMSDEWTIAKHCEEQVVHHFDPNAEGQDGHTSYLVQESPRFIKPEEEGAPGPQVQPDLGGPLSRMSNFAAAKRTTSADLHMSNEEEEEELEEEVLEDCKLEEPKRSDCGSDCVMNEEDLGVSTSQTASLDPDSECLDIPDQSSVAASQNVLQFDSASASLRSWGSAGGSGALELKISHANQIRVKQEEDDAIPLGDKVPKLNASYVLHPQDPNSISPSDRSAIAETLRTMEASEGLELCNDAVFGRQRTFNRRERRFLCVLCGKSFDRMSHLDRHQRIHTGEKPYSCVTCGRSFTQKSSLKGHMRTHTEERAFSCSLCGMSFPTRASQYRHQCSVQPSC